MSISTEGAVTPSDLNFDLADRMRRGLRISGIGVQEMADYLGVARNTVSSWINGRIVPSVQTQRLWALRTGVPLAWLQTGVVPPSGGPNGPEWAPRGSNPEPADSMHQHVLTLRNRHIASNRTEIARRSVVPAIALLSDGVAYLAAS